MYVPCLASMGSPMPKIVKIVWEEPAGKEARWTDLAPEGKEDTEN